MLLIKVKSPADFDVSEPIPLKLDVDRESLLPDAQLFSIVHFPYGKNKKQVLEIAIGNMYNTKHQDNQGMLLCI